MNKPESVFGPPHLHGQPATRKKLIYSGLWVMIAIAFAAAFAYLSDLEQAGQAPPALTALYLVSGGGTLLSLALVINVFNRFSDLASEQFRAELRALTDTQLLLCGQLKNQVANEEWQIIRSVLRERWVDWDVRLNKLLAQDALA